MRRLLGLILGVMLVMAPSQMPAQAKKNTKSVKDLRGNLQSIEKRKGQVAKQLNQTKKAVRIVRGDLAQVNNKLDQVQVALEQTTDRLSDGRKEQQNLGSRLELAGKDLAETKEKVRQRLRWYYVHGQESNLALLVNARSAGELATWKDLMERVAEKDRQLFQKYKDLRTEIAGKKHRQDQLVTEIRGLVDTQNRQKGELSEIKKDKESILGDLRQKQAELQKVLNQLDADASAIESQIEAYLRAQRSSGQATAPAPKGKFTRPSSGRITSKFGMRFHPILKRSRLHAGIDFGAPSGSPIWAAQSGTVIAAQRMRGYGNVVIVDHGGGITTTYAHCSRFFVGRGAKVSRGQRIASVGATGLATGPHLHFEVRVNGKAVDPMRYL